LTLKWSLWVLLFWFTQFFAFESPIFRYAKLLIWIYLQIVLKNLLWWHPLSPTAATFYCLKSIFGWVDDFFKLLLFVRITIKISIVVICKVVVVVVAIIIIVNIFIENKFKCWKSFKYLFNFFVILLRHSRIFQSIFSVLFDFSIRKISILNIFVLLLLL